MTKLPKWWSDNGPPSPTTPVEALELQVKQDRTTYNCLQHNRYYELDDNKNSFMFKYQLSDGTFVFTTHPSLQKLSKVLKTTKQLSPSKHLNKNRASPVKSNKFSHLHDYYESEDDADYTIVQRKSPKLKPLPKPQQKSKPGKNPPLFMKLTKLESKKFTLP